MIALVIILLIFACFCFLVMSGIVVYTMSDSKTMESKTKNNNKNTQQKPTYIRMTNVRILLRGEQGKALLFQNPPVVDDHTITWMNRFVKGAKVRIHLPSEESVKDGYISATFDKTITSDAGNTFANRYPNGQNVVRFLEYTDNNTGEASNTYIPLNVTVTIDVFE